MRKFSIISSVIALLALPLLYQNCGNKFEIKKGKVASITGGDDTGLQMQASTANVMVGEFKLLPFAVQSQIKLKGRVMLVRNSGGTTDAFTHVSGLTANTMYMAHVHNKPCNVDNGGGHYQVEVGGPANTTNEIWPSVTTDGNGVGNGSASVDHIARAEAQSIVIHNPGMGERIACADLVPQLGGSNVSGNVTTTAAGMGIGYNFIGSAIMRRKANGRTEVQASILATLNNAPLADQTTLMAHVHNDTCANPTSTHYKINPDVVDALQSNEIWPTLVFDGDGYARADVEVDHIAGSSAQSIVVHAPDAQNVAQRVACIDLNIVGSNGMSMKAGLQAANIINASGSLIRNEEGSSFLSYSFAGLNPNTSYMSHVHNLPCSLGAGGHYQKTVGGPANNVNEIWPMIMTDASGAASGEMLIEDHLARPEAQSIIIHDPANAAFRIMCIDL